MVRGVQVLVLLHLPLFVIKHVGLGSPVSELFVQLLVLLAGNLVALMEVVGLYLGVARGVVVALNIHGLVVQVLGVVGTVSKLLGVVVAFLTVGPVGMLVVALGMVVVVALVEGIPRVVVDCLGGPHLLKGDALLHILGDSGVGLLSVEVVEGGAVSEVDYLQVPADLLSNKELVVVALVAFRGVGSVVDWVVRLDVALAYIHGLINRVIEMGFVLV